LTGDIFKDYNVDIKTLLEEIMKSFVLTLVLTVVSFVGGILYFGSGFGLFFTPLPLIILILFPLIYQCILYENFFKKAFVIIFEKNISKDYLQKAYNFFKHYGQMIWITTITLIALYTAVCMKFLEDKSGLGPMFQFILDAIIYAGLLHLIVVLPYKIIIKNKIMSFSQNFSFGKSSNII
jgi:hypothetical protein